jgi:hypothetical protein
MQDIQRREEVNTGLWWENQNERDHMEGVILEWVLEKSVDLAQSWTVCRFL